MNASLRTLAASVLVTSAALAPSLAFAQDGDTAPAAELEALNISAFGIGPAVEESVVRKIRSLIAKAYAQNKVDQIVTLGYGIEGGMSVCVQKSRFVGTRADLEALRIAILAIPYSPGRTSKDAQWTASCQQGDAAH